MTDRPLQSIVHPTDFSQAGLDAFAHALRLAVAAKSHFHILHIDREDELADWVQFPRVREMLAAWGMIAPDAPRSAVASELGLKVSKVIIESNDPVRSVGAFVESHPCDLLVLMIHARSAPRWLQGSVAEAAVRRAHAPALFLLEDHRGFVDRKTGAISLKTILLPIDGAVPHRDAWRWVAAFERLAAPGARVRPLHVGSSTPENASEFEGTIDVRKGPVVETIVSVAEEIGADIVAMPTAGRHGLFDALRGSVTERVLHEAPCPVLAIPMMQEPGAHFPSAGQRVRVVEVPADTGVHGLFENLHDFPDAAQFAKHLAGAAKTYYARRRGRLSRPFWPFGKTKVFIRQGVQAFIDGRKLAAKR